MSIFCTILSISLRAYLNFPTKNIIRSSLRFLPVFFPVFSRQILAILLIKTTKHTQKKLSEINLQKEWQSDKELFYDIKTFSKQCEATHMMSRLASANCYVMTNLFLIKEHFPGSNTRQSVQRSVQHLSLSDHSQSKMSTRSD